MAARWFCVIVAAVALALTTEFSMRAQSPTGAAQASGAGQGDLVDPAQALLALDPRWTVEFAAPPAVPAGYDAQAAYVPLKNGELVAVALEDGSEVWRAALVVEYPPATGDGLVFVARAGEILALDQRTGARIWRTALDHAVAAPLHWEAGWLIASTTGGTLLALRAESGRILWQSVLDSPLAVPPSLSGDRLFAALQDRRVVALTLESGGLEWTQPLPQEITGLVALSDQILAGTRGNRLHSLNGSNGRFRWSQKAGADIRGAAVADEEHIYFVAMDNLLRALDRSSGSVKWTRGLPTRPAGGPIRTSNVIIVPLVSTDMGAYDWQTGAPAFTIKAAGELAGVPYLREVPRPTAPRLIAISRDGKLQGFASRFDPVPAPLPELPGVRVTGE